MKTRLIPLLLAALYRANITRPVMYPQPNPPYPQTVTVPENNTWIDRRHRDLKGCLKRFR